MDEGVCARCRRTPSVISRSRAGGLYDGALRRIVHAFKYGGRLSLAPRLAALARTNGREILEGADFVVPVPLHWRRQRARGFNQAAELASHLGLPVCRWLRRRRSTLPQMALPAGRRHHNVKEAFALAGRPWFLPLSRPLTRRLKGRCVVLVDDVSTTGATLEACARVLSAAGVREVRALTVARVVARRGPRLPRPRPVSGAGRQP